jgi:hypothetical protein
MTARKSATTEGSMDSCSDGYDGDDGYVCSDGYDGDDGHVGTDGNHASGRAAGYHREGAGG